MYVATDWLGLILCRVHFLFLVIDYFSFVPRPYYPVSVLTAHWARIFLKSYLNFIHTIFENMRD